MKDWITYLKENLDNDIWGFIFLDYYYNYSAEKHENILENYEPEKFIDENINELSKEIKDLVHFHGVFLKICVQLLFDPKKGFEASMISIFNKSHSFLVKNKKTLTESQIEAIIAQYGNPNNEASYRKKEVFEKYLINKGFIKKPAKKITHSELKRTSGGKNIKEKSEIFFEKKNTQHLVQKGLTKEKKSIKKIRKAIFVTAIEEEFQILDKSFILPTISEHHPDTKKAYQKGIFETAINIWEIMLVKTGKFNDTAATETALLIQHFKPEIALFVGTAGRLDKSLGIGDIIIPPVVVGYDYGKDRKEFTEVSLNNINPSSTLIEFATAIQRDETFMNFLRLDKGNFPSSQFNIIIDEDKQIASGNMTVKDFNSQAAKRIRELFPDVVAVDMEGIGFFKACEKFPKVEYILIRGIADYLNNKRSANRAGSREIAMSKASKIAFEILNRNT